MACALFQTVGAAVAWMAVTTVGELATTVRCLAREHAFLSTLGITRAVANHGQAFPLVLITVGHVAPLFAMRVLGDTFRPASIQATFTACQVIIAFTVWLALVSDFVRTNWNLNCF